MGRGYVEFRNLVKEGYYEGWWMENWEWEAEILESGWCYAYWLVKELNIWNKRHIEHNSRANNNIYRVP